MVAIEDLVLAIRGADTARRYPRSMATRRAADTHEESGAGEGPVPSAARREAHRPSSCAETQRANAVRLRAEGPVLAGGVRPPCAPRCGPRGITRSSAPAMPGGASLPCAARSSTGEPRSLSGSATRQVSCRHPTAHGNLRFITAPSTIERGARPRGRTAVNLRRRWPGRRGRCRCR
jgi:hypothetical protein